VASGETDDIELDQLNDGGSTTASGEVYLKDLELGDVNITVAAIGNSSSIGDTGDYELEATQTVDGTRIEASLTVEIGGADGDRRDHDDHGSNDASVTGDAINATSAAIGNSLSAYIYSGDEVEIDQTVESSDSGRDRDDWDNGAQIQANLNVETDSIGDVTITAAAIGNSASLQGFSGGVGQVASISQTNHASVSASATLHSPNPTSVTATSAAIGNSASIRIVND